MKNLLDEIKKRTTNNMPDHDERESFRRLWQRITEMEAVDQKSGFYAEAKTPTAQGGNNSFK